MTSTVLDFSLQIHKFLNLLMISTSILKGKSCEELESVRHPKSLGKRSGFVFPLFVSFMTLWFFPSFFHDGVVRSLVGAQCGAELPVPASQGPWPWLSLGKLWPHRATWPLPEAQWKGAAAFTLLLSPFQGSSTPLQQGWFPLHFGVNWKPSAQLLNH